MKALRITSKGQVTIPKKVRKALNLEAGDQVLFLIEGDWAILVPAKRQNLMDLQGAFSSSVPYTSHQEIRHSISHERGKKLLDEASS